MKQKDELREASSASSFMLHPSSLFFSHPSSLIPPRGMRRTRKLSENAPEAMFDNLQDKMDRVFKTLRGEAALNEWHIDNALKEIRVALLEADVHFKVVK